MPPPPAAPCAGGRSSTATATGSGRCRSRRRTSWCSPCARPCRRARRAARGRTLGGLAADLDRRRRPARARRSAAITCCPGLDRVDHRSRAAVGVRPVEQEHVREARHAQAEVGARHARPTPRSSVRPPTPAISIGATNPCVAKPVASTITSYGRSTPSASRMPGGVTAATRSAISSTLGLRQRRIPLVGEHDPLAADLVGRRDLAAQLGIAIALSIWRWAIAGTAGISQRCLVIPARRAPGRRRSRRGRAAAAPGSARTAACARVAVLEVHLRQRPAGRALVDVDLLDDGWIAGTTWIALQPVPTTATRLPARSTSWRQRAVWNAGPAKLSSPGIGGTRRAPRAGRRR